LMNMINLPLTTLIKETYNNIKDSKHSPVYRKRGAEGFSPLFSFFFVNLGKADSKMRTKCLVIATLVFCFLCCKPIFAQQPVKISIDYVIWDEDNPVPADTTQIIIHTHVFCTDDNNVNIASAGNIRYWVQSDSMYNTLVPPKMVDWSPANVGIPLIGKQDTVIIPLDSLILRTGPVNVIIIWPSLVNPTINLVDSGFAQFQLYTVGLPWIEDPVQNFGSTVFPNPSLSTQMVFVNSKYSKEISKIIVINSLGQVMDTKQFAEGESGKGYIIPTEDLRPGIYHIHLVYSDNKSEVVKFIKN